MENKNFVDSSFYLNEQFKADMPFACGKIGNCELMCINNYYEYTSRGLPVEWWPVVSKEIYENAGVFPQTEESRIDFIKEISKSLLHVDSLALWSSFNKDFEYNIIKSYNKKNILIDLQSLEPFYSGSPWTEHLKNKRVLVISPFSETIKKQYEKRDKIWSDKRILPDFELTAIKHQHSPGIDIPSKYINWIEMTEDLKSQMDNQTYDILLVGAGASSLPLIAHAKQRGKKSIHLGGPLQILFGIKGERWNKSNIGKFFYNNSWVQPSIDETPTLYKNIEGGCYW